MEPARLLSSRRTMRILLIIAALATVHLVTILGPGAPLPREDPGVAEWPLMAAETVYGSAYGLLTGARDYRHGAHRLGYIYAPGNASPQLLRRNISIMAWGPGLPPMRITTNRHGLRDGPVSPRPPDNTTRVLVVGDSYVFGLGVNASDRFTAVLERRLNAMTGDRYQVVNAGVPGWGMKDYEAFLREDGLALHPDVVVVTVIGNDWMSFETAQQLQRQAFRDVKEERNDEGGSTLSDAAADRFQELKNRHTDITGYRHVADIRRMLEARNITGIYYLAGSFPDSARRKIRWYIGENRTVISAHPELRDDWDSTFCLRYSPNTVSVRDTHPSPTGHRLLAESLLPAFVDHDPYRLPWQPQGLFQWIDPC